jgi:hypothetical protein
MGQLRIIAESKREIINLTSSRRGFTWDNPDEAWAGPKPRISAMAAMPEQPEAPSFFSESA